MPVRAAWHTDVELVAEQRIEEVGLPIVLDAADGRAALAAALVRTIDQEGRLAERGMTCKIKDTFAASCHSCRLYDAHDELCQVAREQERLCTELRVMDLGGRRQ